MTSIDKSLEDLVERLESAIGNASKGYNKLMILVGGIGSGKTESLLALSQAKGHPYVNLNLELSRRLLDLSKKERISMLQRCVEEIIDSLHSDIVLLDNTELLFSQELKVDVPRLLRSLSRTRTIVFSWSGASDGYSITYADPRHPEYRECKMDDLEGIIIWSDREEMRQ